jgi:hypothetical protein
MSAEDNNKLIRSLEYDDPELYAGLLDRTAGGRRAGLKIDGVELHVLARLIRSAFADLEYAAEQSDWERPGEANADCERIRQAAENFDRRHQERQQEIEACKPRVDEIFAEMKANPALGEAVFERFKGRSTPDDIQF